MNYTVTIDSVVIMIWISPSNKTAYSLSNNIPYDLLAEQIIEFKGKVLGQRVLDIECHTIETTLMQTGNVNGLKLM